MYTAYNGNDVKAFKNKVQWQHNQWFSYLGLKYLTQT